jgi:hypothetical protein
LAGAKAAAKIGDRGVGRKSLVLQFEQANAPGVGIAVLFQTERLSEKYSRYFWGFMR